MPQDQVGQLAHFDRADFARDAVGDGRVDRVFRHVTPDAQVVVVALFARQAAALLPHLVRRLPGAGHDFSHAPHRLAVARDHADCAEIVQDVLGGDGFVADPAFRECNVLGNVPIQMVANHQHVEMFVERVDGERPRRIRGARKDVCLTAHPNNVGSMASPGTLRVIRVDCPAFERCDRIVDESRLVERVGVNRDLHVVLVRHGQATIDGGRRRAPVFVELQADGACADLLVKPLGPRTVPLAEEPEIHRQRIGRLQHPLEIPRSRRARSGFGARCRAGSTADKGRDATAERHVHLLRADEVNVRIDPAGCQDEAFAGDGFGRGADDHVRRNAGHHIRIAGLADSGDASVLDADVGLVDAGPVDHQRVRNHEIQRARFADTGGLAHAVAKHLASAELALVAVRRMVSLNFCDEVGIAKAYAIAGRRPVDVGVVLPRHAIAHSRPPWTTRLPGNLDERDAFGFARFESHRSARRYVQASAGRGLPIELERPIRLREVIVAADLNRPIAEVGDFDLNRLTARVDENVLGVAISISPGMTRFRSGAADPRTGTGVRPRGAGTGRKLPYSANSRLPISAAMG